MHFNTFEFQLLNMKQSYVVIVCLISVVLLKSCASSKPIKLPQQTKLMPLPDDLTKISDKDVLPIVESLESARVIGVTECVHEMIEPFLFRNALIKQLVTEQKIGAIAIESGFTESRLCYDYILGKDIALDSVMNNGFSCMFGTIDANKELLTWLRKYNEGKASNEQVHFYGFDVPGCPPNPYVENAYAGFDYVFNYLNGVDASISKEFQDKITPYKNYLRIEPNYEEGSTDFRDLDSVGWSAIVQVLDELESRFSINAMQFEKASSELDYRWALHAVVNARANVDFLRSMGNPTYTYDVRDFQQFENIQWIAKNEHNKRLLLFAHSVHLMKEIHSNGTEMNYPRCGEYLGEAYGKEYVVIGNFYRKLDGFDGEPLELEEGTLGFELAKIGPKNFVVDVKDLDKSWNKEWLIRYLNSGNELKTILNQGVDFIYFNDTQTTLSPTEE